VARRDFCETYGVRVPVVLAGMGLVSEPELVAAVSEAGGLGILGTGPLPPAELSGRIADVRARTRRPFGVNQIVETTRLGPLTTDAHVQVLVDERVSPVVFHWDPPPREWLTALAAAGSRIWRTVNSLEGAKQALAEGADALVVQGEEAGGHNRSTTPLRELLPGIVREAGARHVVAAGGIADAAGVASALALGADAVCMGTRFVACVESAAHPEWQRRIVAAGPDDTAITRIFGPEWPDAPMRVLRNRAVRRAERGEASPPASQPIGTTQLSGQTYPMPVHSAVLPTRATEGDFDEMCLAAGTSVAAIARVERAADVVAMVERAWKDARSG
jgi:NAD(P)H-dependent flavin oxidoreductase YrpB (nitropropane dioxygenase family)